MRNPRIGSEPVVEANERTAYNISIGEFEQ
jgi:hypothetical protein